MAEAVFILNSERKREQLIARIKAVKLEDQIFEFIVRPYQPRRTNEQNARLHLIFSQVAKATGSDIESVKLGYKAMFLPGKEVDTVGGKFKIFPKTSKMTKAQLREFMDACESHAIGEFGILIGENEYQYR